MTAAIVCTKCKNTCDREGGRCSSCLEKKRARGKKRRQEFLASGLCSECGTDRDNPDLKLCKDCRDRVKSRNSARYKKHQSEGKCYGCSAPATGKFCPRCRSRSVEWNKNRRVQLYADGQCIQCYENRDTPSGKLCALCVVKGSARKWLGGAKHADDLLGLLESQGRLCPYSGRELVIGLNAVVDHKNPRSRGGSSSIDNLQWVDDEVNRAKTDMTHDEFISLCRLIASRFAT